MDHSQIRRSNFFNIVKELTYSEEVLLGPVDYVQTLLMSDSVALVLQLVIDKFIFGDIQKELSLNLYSLTQFLKYMYNKHMIEEDECYTHSIE